jgi:exopolysaccharide/PEP-CTERM locus tyrosine autokinase
MSKIQDALAGMKAISKRQAIAPETAAPQKRLATVVTREHGYGGNRIVVDPVELRASGLLAPGADERRLAEQYRAIKRPLLGNADPSLRSVLPLGNLLMVASALSGEGKTFTSVNLCLSIARERDWSVVLVDADSSKPHLTRLFSAEDEPGLIELLRNPELSFEDIVMPTDIPGLSLLPAGASDAHASELLASRRMKELCQQISSSDVGRMIVFDSSPLLLTTEAIALASQVGQVLMVVRADSTEQQSVLAALDKLDPEKATNCVLNRTSGADRSESYGYYGDYGDVPPSPES